MTATSSVQSHVAWNQCNNEKVGDYMEFALAVARDIRNGSVRSHLYNFDWFPDIKDWELLAEGIEEMVRAVKEVRSWVSVRVPDLTARACFISWESLLEGKGSVVTLTCCVTCRT